ncbi:NAD-dependent epimerase/dehydratase family protein [Jannaschia seohaensis]|uniref:UDP-glucuronate 4-epimerase n=1 Tax=Jannaschia seohaensis TaxID=475081 RepID=A0A2Y9ASU9_9RHOB|nr:NAD-dependent epimerase/dehydratase family protein [Jannaschia seohaensis]PWJ17438.1 UDP-glucuronate 4-epimerase [Jannaschia seohaensis]SSA47501.1 UDP-glucuronate 4-epimerase [Jannaschia seohaensis]
MARHALVTGTAGFIGFHMARALLAQGWTVTGLDALTPYYDLSLKRRRHAILAEDPSFEAIESDVAEEGAVAALLAARPAEAVIHLAAQAGVRYSIEVPRDYVRANVTGTHEVLEAAREHPPKHLLLASSSSVYGAETEMPYREGQKVDTQMSFYAATKKANEAMAHAYAHLYGIPTTLFRFFTVYGPWGRPDMALFKFVAAMRAGRPIDVYNHGEMQRDFTYVDDLVTGIAGLIDVPPGDRPVGPKDSLSPVAPFRIVNIGNGEPVKLGRLIAAIEAALGQKAERNLMDIQPGDVPATWADASLLETLLDHPLPRTSVEDGVAAFVDWYLTEYEGK